MAACPEQGGVIYIGVPTAPIGMKTTIGAWASKPIEQASPTYDANKLGYYDALFHDHNETFTDWGSTAASAMSMGNMAVVQSTQPHQLLLGSVLRDGRSQPHSLSGDSRPKQL